MQHKRYLALSLAIVNGQPEATCLDASASGPGHACPPHHRATSGYRDVGGQRQVALAPAAAAVGT